jgi:hypothetical protein
VNARMGTRPPSKRRCKKTHANRPDRGRLLPRERTRHCTACPHQASSGCRRGTRPLSPPMPLRPCPSTARARARRNASARRSTARRSRSR